MAKVSPKDIIRPIEWLIGNWRSVQAYGEYPGIKSFSYEDYIEFKYNNQPLLDFISKSYYTDHKRAHVETGFMKMKPDSNLVSFLLSHNFGLTTVEEGVVCGNQINLKSTEISRVSFSTDTQVCELQRNYTLVDGTLLMELYMATNKKPLSKHLTVEYVKVDDVCP